MAGLLIHEDPLLGVSSYWKTRPIRPFALLAAKAVFAFVFLALVPGLVDVAVLARYGLDVGDWPVTLLRSVGEQAAWLACAGAVAAVTWSIPAYLLGIAAAGLLWVAGVLTLDHLVRVRELTEWVQLSIVAAASGIALLLQYNRRPAALSVGLLAAIYALSPWGELLPVESLAMRAVATPAPLPAVLVEVESQAPERPFVTIRLGLAEGPEGAFFDVSNVRAGLAVENGRTYPALADSSPDMRLNAQSALASALPGHAWFGARSQGRTVNPTLSLRPVADTPPGEIAKHLVAIQGEAWVEEYAYERVSAIPLRQGAQCKGRSMSFSIVRVEASELEVYVHIDGAEMLGPVRHNAFVLVDSRHNLASRSEPWFDFGSNSMAEVARAGQRVSMLSGELSFFLPRTFRTPDLSTLELQVWRPILKRRHIGKIELSNL